MVAVVSGSGLGLFNSSSSTPDGAQGDSTIGRGNDRAYVNTANGNLIVQSVDDVLVGVGIDATLVRTYNSQGLFDGDNDDGWRIGFYRRVVLNGALGDPDSTVIKTFGDGSEVIYRYVASSNQYVSTDGDGAHDTLSFASGQWTWTDGTAQVTETYDGTGRLVAARDASNNLIQYLYTGNLLTQVLDASGQQTFLEYVGNQLASVRTVSQGQQQTLTFYSYDAQGRLSEVSVDFSSTDASIADRNTYVTTYRYVGTTNLLERTTQRGGYASNVLASQSFTYEFVGGMYRVKTVTDGEGRVTTFNYSLSSNAGGQVTSFASVDSSALSTTDTQITQVPYSRNNAALTTPTPGWVGATLLESANGAVIEPKVAFDANGNGFAIWAQGGDVFARRYTRVNDTWAAAVTLSANTNTASAPTLSLDDAGNAVVAWAQSDGNAVSAWGVTFNVATNSWGAAALLEGTNLAVATTAYSVSASIAGSQAAVAFLQTDGTRNNLYVARWNGSAWSAAVLVEARTNAAAQPSVAVDSLGNVSVVLQQSNGTANSVYTNRYTAATGTWSGATLLENSNTAIVEPKIAFAANGDGFAVWAQGTDVFASRYTRATNSWAAAVPLDGNGNTASAPSLAVDAAGNAVAAWAQSNGTAVSAYAAIFNTSTGTWGAATLLENTDLAVATTAYSISTDIVGTRAAVAWLQTDGTRNNAYVARWDGSAWSSASSVEARTNAAAQPSVAIDALGNAVVAFQQSNGTANSFYANRYVGDVAPYYTVASGNTWRSIANAVYGVDSDAAGQKLSEQLSGQTLALGNRLTGFPPTLLVPTSTVVTVAPYYDVLASDDWTIITGKLYGTRDPNAVLALRGATGDPTLAEGLNLNVPTTLRYTPSGAVTITAGNPLISTTDQVKTAQAYGLLPNGPTNAATLGWQPAQALENREFSTVGQYPRVHFDANGNGIALWSEGNRIYARRYDATSQTWLPESIVSDGSSPASAAEVAIDQNGNAVALWTRWNFTTYRNSLNVSVYNAATGSWGAATSLGEDAYPYSDVGQRLIKMSAAGAAFAYTQNVGGVMNLHVMRYLGGAWSNSLLVESGSASVAAPGIAMDDAGNVTLTWTQSDGARTQLYSNRWLATSATLAGVVQLTSISDYTAATEAQLGGDAQGNLIVAWTAGLNLFVRRFDAVSGTWGVAQSVAPNARGHKLAMDSAGNAVLAWSQVTGASQSVLISRFDRSTGAWSLPDAVATTASSYYPSQVVLEIQGKNIAFFWEDSNSSPRRVYGVIGRDGVWTPPQAIDQVTFGQSLSVSMDAAGNIIFVEQRDPMSWYPSAWTGRFNAPSYTVPSGATWRSIANALYGVDSDAAGEALHQALGNQAINAGARLINLPTKLVVESTSSQTVPPFYVVQAGDTWSSIAQAVYGSSNADIVVTLRRVSGDPELMAGLHLTVPQTLYYGSDTIYLQTDVVDALGAVNTYVRDSQGRLTAHRSPEVDGVRVDDRFEYDSAGNLTRIIRDFGGLHRVTDLAYDVRGNLTDTWDSLGNSTTRSYDQWNQLLAETSYTGVDPDGSGAAVAAGAMTTHFVYDTGRRLRYVVTADQRVTEHIYNGFGQRIADIAYSVARYTGQFSLNALDTWRNAQDLSRTERTDYSYDFRGNLSSERRYDDSGAVSNTGYQYDQRGRLIIRQSPTGSAFLNVPGSIASRFFSYDALGDVSQTSSSLDSMSLLSQYTRDAVSNLETALEDSYNGDSSPPRYTITRRNLAGQATSVTRSAFINNASVFDTTIYAYDAVGRLRMATDSLGVRTYKLYDAMGRTIGDIDGEGRLTRYFYNGASEIIKTQRYSRALDATALATLVGVDGRPAEVTIDSLVATLANRDPSEDQISRAVYDAAGRLVYSIDASGGVTETRYDGTGRVIGTIAYFNRLLVVIPDDAGDVSVSQFAPGGTHAITPEPDEDRVTRNFYDADGNLRAVLDGEGFLTEYKYDGAGHLVEQVAYANLTAVAQRANGTLDDLRPAPDLPEQTDDPESDIRSYYFYDVQGRRTAEVDGKGFLTETVYDRASNVAQIIRYGNAVTVTSSSTLASLRPTTGINRTTSFLYNGLGGVVRETNHEGTVTNYRRDAAGHALTTTQAAGTTEARTTLSEYDGFGRVSRVLSAEGAAAIAGGMATSTAWSLYGTRFEYDTRDHRIASVDPNGNRTLYFYDKSGELRFTVRDMGDGSGELTEYRYDALEQLTDTVGYSNRISTAALKGGLVDETLLARAAAAADPLHDSVVTNTYWRTGELRSVTDGVGASSWFDYNAFGDRTAEFKRIEGDRTRDHGYVYDRRGLKIFESWEPEGINRTESIEYDAFGRQKSVTDQYGNVVSTEYDTLGRVVASVDAVGHRRTSTYDAFSRVRTTVDALGGQTTYTYDDAARSVAVTTPEGITVTTVHYRDGQTFTVTDSNANVTTYQYDANGQLRSVSDALGTLETRTYDRGGRLETTVDGRQVTTRLQYDAANRLFTRTQDFGGLALQTTYVYDGQGRVTRVTEPGGRITDTNYYADGRVRDVIVDPDGLHIVTHYDYDLTGNAILVTEDATGQKPRITQYMYDDLGRRTDQIVDPTELGGATALNLHTQYRYNRDGNLTRKIDAEGHSTWYVYDANDRLKETIDAMGGVTSVAYDAEGRVTETRRHATALTDTAGYGDIVTARNVAPTVDDRVTRSFYDADGRERFTIATSSATVNGGVITERGVVTERTFDVHGNVVQVRVHRDDIAIPTAAQTSDIAGLVTSHPEDRIASTLYDLRGRAVFNIDVYRGITRNWYDAAGQLTRTTTYAVPPDGSVSLDVAGLTAWSDAREGSATDHTRRFWYDAVGRVRYALDGEGYLKESQYLDASRQVIEYAYSNKPTSLDPPSVTADPAHDKKTTTLRDAAGRVEEVRQELRYGAQSTTVYEKYTYDGLGNKRTYRNANGAVWTYDYDANGRLSAEFSPELWVTSVNTSGNDLVGSREFVSVVTRMTYDALGNVKTRTEGIRRTVATGIENATGARTTTYDYDLLGRQTSVTHPQTWVYSEPAGDPQNTDVNDQLKETLVTPVSVTTYNALGDAITNVDVNGARSRKAYDALGRLRFDVDALGFVTEYVYDNFGNVTELTRHAVALSPTAISGEWTATAIDAAVGTNSADRTIHTEYDRLNRRTRVTQPYFTSYTPDAAGELPGVYVSAGAETKYEYDAFGQLTHESRLIDQERVVYSNTWFVYDNNGQRRYTVNDKNYVTEERFDALGHVIFHDEYAKAISGSGPWTLSTVQAAIQPTLHGDAHPEGIDRKTTFEYDSLGRVRLQQVYEVEYKTGTAAGTGTDFATQTTKYDYDAVGNRTRVTDAYNADTWTYYDVLGRVRAIIEPPRSADTNGDYFTEANVLPLTEMNRNAYGDLVEQVRYANGATIAANDYVAPAGATLTTRLLLDLYGHVRSSQDGTLAPDGSRVTKFFSYNVRGDVAKEWQVFTDADNRKYVQSVIHRYDALGRETMTIQPQVRSDTVPVGPTTFQLVRAAGFMTQPGGGQWINDNEVNAFFTPVNVPGQVWVYLDYTRINPNGPPNDPHHQSAYVSGSASSAVFTWTDSNTQPPDFPANGGIASIERVRVYAQDAQGHYTVLLRDSNGNPPGLVTGNSQVAYTQTRYDGFGEIIERGVNAAPVDDNTRLQEYWSYDAAGHVWRSNADGGIDKVFLYDVASRVTAEIRNPRADFIRNLTDASGAYYAGDRVMTETLYDSLDHIVAQRTPTFAIDERLDPAATSVSISLVNGKPFLQWAGTLDPSVKTDFKYTFNFIDWLTLPVVQVAEGVLGVDVSGLARPTLVNINFQIVKSLSLQFAPFAISSGTFHVLQGETVSFGIQSRDNPRVATPVIGPGPAAGPTTFGIERRAQWYQSGPTGQWIYDNKVNAFWDSTGLTGNVRVYLYYTRELAGGNAIGDTEMRWLDVNGAAGYADFTWTDVNRFPPDNPVNGGIWSVQKIEVYGQNAQGQYTVLLRGPNAGPPGPVRLRWDAPPADQFANAYFYYKRADSSTWSNGITPTLAGGKLEIDVNSLLVDDTVYDYRIEYWQQNTGVFLARKEGQIDSSGLFVNQTLNGSLVADPLTGVFDQLVPVADVNGLSLRWADPGAVVDEIEFRWGVPGSGTYPNVLAVTRSGGFASVDVGGLPPSTDYAYQVSYRIGGRTVSQQQNVFHLSAPQSTSTKSAAISVSPDATPQPAQPVATINGSSNVQTASWSPSFESQTYFTPPVSGGNPGQWIGASVVSVAYPDLGTQTVRILLDYHSRTTLQGDAGQTQRWSSDIAGSDHYIWVWQDGNGTTSGNQGIYSIQRVRVYAVTASGATGALLRDSQATGGTPVPPRLTWAAPADTSLTARFFFGLGLGQELTPTLSNGVYTVDLSGVSAATYDFEVRYYRPNYSFPVSLAIGQFVTDGSNVSLNGAQQNIVRDPAWIAASSSGNTVTWSRTASPANSQIYFEYFDGSWHYAAIPVTTNGTDYSVDMTFLPNGTYNNMLYRVSYYTPAGTEPYARGTGTFSVTVTTNTTTTPPVLTRDATPSLNQKYPTQQIGGVALSGTQITWNLQRQAGERVFLRYQINGGAIIELEQPSNAGPAYAVTIPELLVDGTKDINWWVEYRYGSSASPRALANGHGTIVVSSTTTYPVTTLLSANDVYPTAINLANPYQVGGQYSNILHWDANPDATDIVEFRVNGVLVNTLSADRHEIDLSGFSGQLGYELTFRHANQTWAYARNAGTMTIGRTIGYPDSAASLSPVPVQPQATPYVKAKVDRWGNVLEQSEGAVWNALNDAGVMQRYDIVRLRTQFAYNVFGQLTTTTNQGVEVLDTRTELDPNRAIPTHSQDVTTTNYYDMLGRQVATRDENGNVNGVTLNLAGQVTSELHADGGTKFHIYDAFGRQTQVQDEIGWRVRSTYDAANRQTSVQTEWAPELWLTRQFKYDELGRRISETSGATADDGGAETTLYFYDLAGNLIRRRTELGATTTYTYDLEGHQTSQRDAINGFVRFEYDHFGNLLHKWDLSNERTDYYYTGLGQLDWSTSTRAGLMQYQMDYEYDGAGHLTAVIDNATLRRADYGFDTYGRLRRERTVVDGVTHQDTQTTYDAMNRIQKIVDLRYSLRYYYDAHSNRTLVQSSYLDHVHALHSDDLWYTYDEMNRVKLSEGSRLFDQTVGYHPLGITPDRGTYSEYFQNGQRAFTDQYGKGVLNYNAGQYSYVDGNYRESYEYDGAGRLHAIWRSTTANGNDRVEVREYDGASRLTRSEQRRVNQSNTHFYYDDDGKMYQQVVRQTISDEGAVTSKTDFNNDAAGVQRGYLTTVYNPNGTKKEEYSYGNQYRLADGYLLSKQDVQLTKYNSNGGNPNSFYGTIERFYDVNNNVVKLYDSNAEADRKYRYLANNLQGEVMTAIEGEFADDAAVRQAMKTAVEGNANLNYAQHFFHTHGASVGSLGQLDPTQNGQPAPNEGKKARFFGIAMWGDSWAGGASKRPVPAFGSSAWQPPKPPTMNANFDANFTEIGGFQASASDVVVQQGDTLRSIATRLFGDGALWYLLADENGFSDPDAALPVGSNLRVPTQVYSLANTAHIYKPFDPNEATNNKQASLVDPTPPPPKQPCGGHAKLILTIVAVVVTVIVAYFMGPASGPVAAFFQGAIAAVAGNAVSQGIAIGMGMQEGFDWRSAALAGVSGGIGGVVAPAVSQWMPPNSPIAVGFVSGAIGNTITQGASIALGLQKSFSWKDVAMSALSGAANAAIASNAPSGFDRPQGFLGDFAKSLVTGTTSSIVQAAFGGKIDGADIAANAFGTALGNSMVRGLQGPPKLGVGEKQSKPREEGAEDELAEVVVTARRAGAALGSNPRGVSTVGLESDLSSETLVSDEPLEEIVVTGYRDRPIEEPMQEIVVTGYREAPLDPDNAKYLTGILGGLSAAKAAASSNGTLKLAKAKGFRSAEEMYRSWYIGAPDDVATPKFAKKTLVPDTAVPMAGIKEHMGAWGTALSWTLPWVDDPEEIYQMYSLPADDKYDGLRGMLNSAMQLREGVTQADFERAAKNLGMDIAVQVNGMDNTYLQSVANGTAIATELTEAGKPTLVMNIYNAKQNFAWDVLETSLQMWGADIPNVVATRMAIRHAMEFNGDGVNTQVWGHSQGTAISNEAVHGLSRGERNGIELNNFGTATGTTPRALARFRSVENRWDPVPSIVSETVGGGGVEFSRGYSEGRREGRDYQSVAIKFDAEGTIANHSLPYYFVHPQAREAFGFRPLTPETRLRYSQAPWVEN